MLEVLLPGAAVFVGAFVQGAVGFGLNLIAAPLLVLVDPGLVPVPLLMVAVAHSTLATVRERHDVVWREVALVTTGRLPGTALGVLAVALLPARPFAAVVGVAVLVCVGLSLVSWTPRPTPRALLVAGMASGTFGTASSIGGPPLALLYQHSPAARIRPTLAASFLLGSLVSLAALGFAGQLTLHHLTTAAWLSPFLFAGFALSNPARRLLHGQRTRLAVLTVAAISGLVLVFRSLVFPGALG